MTEKELTCACWKIYDKACEDIWKLVSESGHKVFFDDYSFHRYVKHGDASGIVLNGNEFMERIVMERQERGENLVFMTEENIEAERKKEIASEIKELKRRIEQSKAAILESEEKLIKLRKGEIE